MSARTALPNGYRLAFASCYAYSPRGQAAVSERSRLLCGRVKGGGFSWLHCYAARVREQARRGGKLAGFFSPDAILIPVPRCESRPRHGPWVAQRLAAEIKGVGLAAGVWPALVRATPIPRSAECWIWERPSVSVHFESLAVVREPAPAEELILVDDVVTKGRTLLAAALRLRKEFPRARIKAFALVRTLGMVWDIERVLDPCRGEIEWDGRDARRNP